MNPICSSVATLSIAVIFCVYRAYLHVQLRRNKALRERVSYMLWVVAEQAKCNTRSIRVNSRGV